MSKYPSNQRETADRRSARPRAVRGGGRVYDPLLTAWITETARDDITDCDPLGPPPGPCPLIAAGLSLRPWRPADLAAFRALLDDPQVWRHMPEPYPDPLGDDLAGELIAASALPHHVVRAVVAEGGPVGQVRLEPVPGSGTTEAEISYWLGRAHWGKGLGRALVRGAMLRAFANRALLLRIVAKVRPENPASRRVLEAAGFTPAPPPPGREMPGWDWLTLRRQDRRGIRSEASP